MGMFRRNWYRFLGLGRRLEGSGLGSRGGDLWLATDVTRDFFFQPLLTSEYPRASLRASVCLLMKIRMKDYEQLRRSETFRKEANRCYRDLQVLMHALGGPKTATQSLIRGYIGWDVFFASRAAQLNLRIDPVAFGLWRLTNIDTGEPLVTPGNRPSQQRIG